MYERYCELREQKSLKDSDVAKATGITKSTFSDWKNGRSKPKQEKLEKIASFLGVPTAYLMGIDAADTTIPSFPNIAPIATGKLPVLGCISCGEPKFMAEEMEYYTAEGIEIKADFILIAKGDSMINARIEDGDLVFIRQQPMVENGEIAAVAIGEEATLKRVYCYREKAMLILKAENPKYEDMVFMDAELENIRILGKAIGFQGNLL